MKNQIKYLLGFLLVLFFISCKVGPAQNEIPIVKLRDSSDMYLTVGENFIEDGYDAIDYKGYSLSDKVFADYSQLNIWQEGEYYITYYVFDNYGNRSNLVTRKVIVKANYKPIISLVGLDTVMVAVGEDYKDDGATAVGALDEREITVNVDTSSVDTKTPGCYQVVYTATDELGTSTLTRSVIVTYSDMPLLILNGKGSNQDDPFLFGQETCFKDKNEEAVIEFFKLSDPFCLAYNLADGDISARVVANYPEELINEYISGSFTDTAYEVFYTVTDARGKKAESVVRHVQIVEDIIPPTIQLIGPSSIKLEVDVWVHNNAVYSYYQNPANVVMVKDNITPPEDIIVEISDTALCQALASNGTDKLGKYDIDVPANNIYQVTYTATDGSGNKASVTRQFQLVDTTPPVITDFATTDTIPFKTDKNSFIGPRFRDNSGQTGYAQVKSGGGFGDVNTSLSGEYPVVYEISDRAGNSTTANKIVKVGKPTILPYIQNPGFEDHTLSYYTDWGDTTAFNMPGWNLDISALRDYKDYEASDARGEETWIYKKKYLTTFKYGPMLTVCHCYPESANTNGKYGKVYNYIGCIQIIPGSYVQDLKGDILFQNNVSGFYPNVGYSLSWEDYSKDPRDGADKNRRHFDMYGYIKVMDGNDTMKLNTEDLTEIRTAIYNSSTCFGNWETRTIENIRPNENGNVRIGLYKEYCPGNPDDKGKPKFDSYGYMVDNFEFKITDWPYRKLNSDNSVTMGRMNTKGVFSPN